MSNSPLGGEGGKVLLIGYVLLSILVWVIGRLWGGWLFEAATLPYVGAQWILGPLAFALGLGSEIPGGGSLRDVWIVFYVAATALLALCLFLTDRDSPLARAAGIVLAILVWLASGFVNFVAMFRGI